MRVLKNQPVVQRMDSMLRSYEMSNLAMVLQTPTILTTWWLISPHLSTTLPGFKNITDFIAPSSPMVYDRYSNVPMCGIDNLLSQAEWNEETGYDEDFATSGVIYPNTIFPLDNSFFTIDGAEVPALYVVTSSQPVTVRSNPFLQINFRLYSRDMKLVEQLERQVNKRYTITPSSLMGGSLVVEEDALGNIQSEIDSYLEICNLYTSLFYDENKAAFVFDGYPDPNTGHRASYVDMTLWKLMFDERIIIYDDIITYANNIGSKTIDRVFTGSPDVFVDEYHYKRSILYRIFSRTKVKKFDEYRFPYIWEPTPRITKYQGQNIWYIEHYDNTPYNEEADKSFYLWDDDFICRIRNNNPYPIPEDDLECDQCGYCSSCHGSPVRCWNPYLRNAIITWMNGGEIDFTNMVITDDVTIENYYLIPLVLGMYKSYILSMSSLATPGNTGVQQIYNSIKRGAGTSVQNNQ